MGPPLGATRLAAQMGGEKKFWLPFNKSNTPQA